MQEQTLDRDQMLDVLRRQGYRLTRPRRTIVRVIQEFDRAFTADEVLREVERLDPDLGRATVFRTLEVLTRLRALDRIHGPDGCNNYVLGRGLGRHYHHLICSSCGITIPFEACNVEEIYDDLRANTNFQISSHLLEVFGLCGGCRL